MKRLILLTLLLSGCAVGTNGQMAGTGDANYTYKHTAHDGSTCEVTILSGRDLQGARLQIDKDCALTSGADNTRGAEASLTTINKGLEVTSQALSKIP